MAAHKHMHISMSEAKYDSKVSLFQTEWSRLNTMDYISIALNDCQIFESILFLGEQNVSLKPQADC